MPILLALDQGTTSSRAILFSDAGDKIAVAQREFTQHYPQPGWVEHDPQEIWSTQIGVATEVMGIANVRPRDIAAIGITNQRETVIVWNRDTGKPIHRAIVWQDRRTSGMIDRLRADGHEATIIAKTGLVPDAYFSASKVAWILDNIDGARDLAEHGKLAFGTVDSWLVYQLTDHTLHITDVTNASRTMLFNIHTMDWDDDLLTLFSIPRSMLPEVKPSCGVVANVSSALALSGVPIAGIAGDQQSALMGQLCTAPGMVKNTYGTGCFMLMNAGDSPATSKNRLLSTVACALPGQNQFALEGSVYIGGAVVQWLRDGLKIIRNADEVEKLARSVTDNGGVQFVPAFAGLGAPHRDQDARGIICGLTRGVTDGHIARAAIESIAHQVADLFEAMHADCGASIPHLRVDGGAANNALLLQFQADLLQTPIVLPQETETTALGAVYLAGLATSVWEGLDALASHWKVKREFEPAMSPDEAQAHRAAWQRAVERARRHP